MANQIDRPSITTSLADRYKASDKVLAPVAGNFIDTQNKFSTNFTMNQPPMVTELTSEALNYAKTLGINRTKYKG